MLIDFPPKADHLAKLECDSAGDTSESVLKGALEIQRK
jgi:hypothetical protein